MVDNKVLDYRDSKEEINLRLELKKLSKDELIDKVINVCDKEKKKQDFILNISHDLRTPLNIILSVLQCYRGDFNEGKNTEKYLSCIKRNCYKILKLVNNLIDATKLESNYYHLKKVNVDIINIIEWNVSAIDKYAKQKNISLIFDTNVEECIMAVDVEALDRIIVNLLSNAIKFSNKNGNIYINALKKNNNICISVRDEGIGIPKDEQKNIFSRFVKSRKNKESEACGSGIGLDLVRYLVNAHGGDIALKSKENVGSEFIVSLPIIKFSDSNGNDNKKIVSRNKVDILDVEFSDIYLE
ncbi:HAMP domain-containing sensor histidine kinase [Clostridium sp. BJN0001]|uniref:sensor histidine kinase n=1 Tax=Clostridium sp. BJN0001 TaxID=2930219 RepID=UPI001FD1784F|nr:HAMP domain-containing sensor histidine kinase [Clostridium sp. BJN0001]